MEASLSLCLLSLSLSSLPSSLTHIHSESVQEAKENRPDCAGTPNPRAHVLFIFPASVCPETPRGAFGGIDPDYVGLSEAPTLTGRAPVLLDPLGPVGRFANRADQLLHFSRFPQCEMLPGVPWDCFLTLTRILTEKIH